MSQQQQSYSKLREESLPQVHNRKGTDTAVELSQEEMKMIDTAKWNILKYPLITSSTAFLVMKGIYQLTKPGLFQNPISPDERTIVRRKFFKHFISNQMIFFAFLGGFVYGFAKYELTKYYTYISHRRLVGAYLDALESSYLEDLKIQGIQAELIVNKKRQNLQQIDLQSLNQQQQMLQSQE